MAHPPVPHPARTLSAVALSLAVLVPVSAGARDGSDWGGSYGGAVLGFGTLDAAGGAGEDVRPGLRAGYDMDFGRFVLGAGVGLDAGTVALDGSDGELGAAARLGLRGGYDLGRTMLYATAGAARAEGDLGGTEFTGTGVFGGFGAEYRLGERVTLGGEILLYRFGDVGPGGDTVEAATAGLNIGLRF